MQQQQGSLAEVVWCLYTPQMGRLCTWHALFVSQKATVLQSKGGLRVSTFVSEFMANHMRPVCNFVQPQLR